MSTISSDRDTVDHILLLDLVLSGRHTRTQKTQISSLQRIQTRAARLITGAFRATSISALDVEAHTLPVKYLLNKLTFETILRLATSSSYNDIIKSRLKR